jgi:mono/diheme cytochrome c family protein
LIDKNMNLTTLALAALSAFSINMAASAQDNVSNTNTLPPASTKTGVTFEADIKPIFDANCIKCHGENRPGHGIVLTNLESTLKGGKDGKIIVVGDSTKGDLIEAIAHLGDPHSFMPKARKGETAKPLTPEQIGLIRAWIDQGAK